MTGTCSSLFLPPCDIHPSKWFAQDWPVRMVWKASSTLEESSAEVSRKESPCFSAKHTQI